MQASPQKQAMELFRAYEVVMNPANPNVMRAQASQVSFLKTFLAFPTPHSTATKSHHPLTKKQTKFLEAFKGDPHACRACAIELFREPKSRHLACHLMEAVIKLHWTRLSPDFKQIFRNDVIFILGQSLADVPPFLLLPLKSKITDLVKEVAKRDWPEMWPEFFPTLEEVSKGGDAQRELVVLVIRRLVEDVVHFSNDLDKTRCDILMTQLKNVAKAMLGFLLQGLQAQQQAWRDSRGQNRGAALLAVSLMEALQSFFVWTPLLTVLDAGVPATLCSFLSDAHVLRKPAAEALLALVEQDQGKFSVLVRLLFPFEQLDLFLGALSSQAGGSQSENKEFQQCIAKILVVVGKKHLSFVEKSGYQYPPTYEKFVAVMVRLLALPDPQLCEATLPFFAVLVRLQPNKVTAWPGFEKCVPELAGILTEKLVNGLTIKSVHFQDEGSDDDAETARESFVTRYTAALKDLVRKLSMLFPGPLLDLCGAKAVVIMDRMRQLDHASVTSALAKPFVVMQGTVELLDAVLRNGIPADAVQQLVGKLQNLLRLYYEFQSQNPLLLSLKIRSLRSFSAFYRVAPPFLLSVLELLLKVVLFRGPNEAALPHAELSKLTQRVRREACDSFQRLCADNSDLLVPKLGEIAQVVSEKLLNGDTAFAEKHVLRDGLLGVATSLNDVGQQREFIAKLLGPLLTVWQDPSMTANLSDCAKFLEWIGAAPGMQPKWDNVRALVSVLDTFRTMVKRSPVAATQFLPSILPNVFSLCRTLHRLWKPGHAPHQHLLATFPVVFAPDQNLYAELVGRKVERDFGVFLATHLQKVREQVYKVVGVSCKVDSFYAIPNLGNLMNTFVFCELADAAIPHVSMLVEYIIDNMFRFCPQQAYGPFLLPLLPELLQFVLLRLKICWRLENSIKKGENSAASTDDEIVQLKLSMDFCRAWMRVLLHALHVDRSQPGGGGGGGGPPGSSKDAQSVPSALCTMIVSGPPALIRQVLDLLAHTFNETTDNVVLAHALEVLERVLFMLLMDRSLDEVLAKLASPLLLAVSKRANHELVHRILRIVAEIYVKLGGNSRFILQQILVAQCRVNQGQLSQLEGRLHKDGGESKKTPKNRANAFAECLGDYVGSLR